MGGFMPLFAEEVSRFADAVVVGEANLPGNSSADVARNFIAIKVTAC
jgi:hypothetical protein